LLVLHRFYFCIATVDAKSLVSTAAICKQSLYLSMFLSNTKWQTVFLLFLNIAFI